MSALTDRPVVRYIGRDDEAATLRAGAVAADRRRHGSTEGRSPTVFVHTPDNDAALGFARRFHDDVRALRPALPALPEPARPQPPTTLF